MLKGNVPIWLFVHFLALFLWPIQRLHGPSISMGSWQGKREYWKILSHCWCTGDVTNNIASYGIWVSSVISGTQGFLYNSRTRQGIIIRHKNHKKMWFTWNTCLWYPHEPGLLECASQTANPVLMADRVTQNRPLKRENYVRITKSECSKCSRLRERFSILQVRMTDLILALMFSLSYDKLTLTR